jgi:hypothetical protein
LGRPWEWKGRPGSVPGQQQPDWGWGLEEQRGRSLALGLGQQLREQWLLGRWLLGRWLLGRWAQCWGRLGQLRLGQRRQRQLQQMKLQEQLLL